MPVSSASSPVDTAGSIATTIRTKSGIFRWTGQRVSSISARDQRAPGTSSNISALSSCRPSRVPSYLRTICCRNAGARLARLSYVEPRVITVVGSAISSRMILIGFGVVVTTTPVEIHKPADGAQIADVLALLYQTQAALSLSRTSDLPRRRADYCGYLPGHAGNAGQDLQPPARPLSEGHARLRQLHGHPGFCRCPPVKAARRGIEEGVAAWGRSPKEAKMDGQN